MTASETGIAPSTVWKVSEEGRQVAVGILTAALQPELGPLTKIVADKLTAELLGELLAKVCDASGVEVDAGKVIIDEQD